MDRKKLKKIISNIVFEILNPKDISSIPLIGKIKNKEEISPFYTEDFEINGKKFIIDIKPSKDGSYVEGSFRRDVKINPNDDIEFTSITNMFTSFADSQYGENDSGGDQLKIFNYIIKVFYSYIIKYNPKKFIFIARDSRRSNFYQKLVDRFFKSLKLDYKLSTKLKNDSTIFCLEKN